MFNIIEREIICVKMADIANVEDNLPVHDMKVADLKKALKEKGLPSTGNKSDLIQRLQSHMDTHTVAESSDVLEESTDILEESTDVDEGILEENTGDDSISENTEIDSPKKIILSKRQESGKFTAVPIVISASSNSNQLTDEERARKRAERFSAENKDGDKKAQRAERFGTTNIINVTTEKTASDTDKQKQRAERFGENKLNPTGIKMMSETDKLKMRSDRFSNTMSKPQTDKTTLQKRIERFGVVTTGPTKVSLNADISSEAEAKRKRAARFGMT